MIILTRVMMDDLAKQNKLAPGNIVNVASTPVALAARVGAPKPDISTADAFKQTLLSAKSISYADPAKGGLSGVVAGRAIERLGIAEQMKSKTTLVPGAQPPKNTTVPPRPTAAMACSHTSGRPVASTVTSMPALPVVSRSRLARSAP